MDAKMVMITLEEYTDLIEERMTLNMVMKCLSLGAKLSWNGKALDFDGDMISNLLKIMDINSYEAVMQSLRDKEAKDGESV